jgi:hypothetical protein
LGKESLICTPTVRVRQCLGGNSRKRIAHVAQTMERPGMC